MNFLSATTLFAISGAVLILLACTDQAFVKGKSLLEEGRVTEGFSKLEEAVSKQPKNLEYKAYYYRQRENYATKLLREADNARINLKWDEAESKYNQVLSIDPFSERANDGIKAIISGKANELKLVEANDLIFTADLENAKDKIRLVLASDPGNVKARKLLAQIEQKKAAASSPAALINTKFNKTVALEFRDANIKAVFELLSKAAGINFILDKEIRQDSKVSIYVNHTSIQDALQNILSSSQLSKKILNENSVLIYPNSKKADFEEKVIRTFYLNNVDAKQAQNLIKTVVKTKDTFIDDQMNILVMRDSADAVRLAEKLITAYDIGDPEVLLEVEILEISTDKLKEIGARWPSQIALGVTGSGGNGQLTLDEASNLNSSFGRISITDPALILNLRGTSASSNLLANPHIRVKNHRKARVLIGDRVPVITNTSTATGFVAESVTYLDVGLKLNVIPSILIDDEISIDIGLEVSNIVSEVTSKNGTLTYRLGTRDASTTLRLKNGETQILAGLINDEERSTANRVPGLADIPIIGRLFSSNRNSHTKTEIVLLITPKIIRNIVPPESTYVEFSGGTETGNTPAGMPSQNYNNEPLQPAVLEPNPAEIPPPGTYGVDPATNSQGLIPPTTIQPPPTLPMRQGVQQPLSQ